MKSMFFLSFYIQDNVLSQQSEICAGLCQGERSTKLAGYILQLDVVVRNSTSCVSKAPQTGLHSKIIVKEEMMAVNIHIYALPSAKQQLKFESCSKPLQQPGQARFN